MHTPQLAGDPTWPAIQITAPDEEPATPGPVLNSPFPLGLRPSTDMLQVPRRTNGTRERAAVAHAGGAVGSWRLNCRESPHAPRPLVAPKPAPPSLAVAEQDAVLNTLRRLEQYCDSVNNVRARPSPIPTLVAPAPVASGTTTFKKAHRRVHSIEIRPGVATRRNSRRGASITGLEDIVGPALPRTARSAMPSRMHIVLPALNEAPAKPISRHVRTRSLDAILATLRAPKPTLTTSRTTRADLHLFASTGAKQFRYAQDDTVRMLPEGFAPSTSLPSKRASYHGHYGSISKSFGDLSKSATNLRKKVLKPLTRYLA